MKQTEQLAIFQDWLSRHKGLLMKVVRSFSFDRTDQEDLLQEISLQLWNSVPKYENAVAETTWIYRVSLYTAIGWSRKKTAHEKKKQPLPAADQLLERRSDPTDPRLDWLYEQIAKLDELDRSLTLLMLDGFSYSEMADTFGMSNSNVGVRINRIKKQLVKQSNQENLQ